MGDPTKLFEQHGIPVTSGESDVEAASTDFGGLVRRRPACVARPTTPEQVARIARLARELGQPLVARGMGHAQAGHCLSEGAIVVDMRGLDRVLGVDVERGVVEVEAGTRWRTIIDGCTARGVLPRGLTHVCDPTIGGTLSIAGVGAEAWAVGAQVNAVEWIDVVTLDGDIVRCSTATHRDLFDAARSGLGQCGIIVRAAHPVRAHAPMLRWISLVYDDAARFVEDAERVCAERRVELVGGMLVEGAGRRPWSILLMLGKEHREGEVVDEGAIRDGLGFDSSLPSRVVPVWTSDAAPGHPFFRRYDPPPGPPPLHPWVEHLFDARDVASVLEELLSGRVLLLRLGTNAIILVARTGNRAPLFAEPRGNRLMFGVGLFVTIPREMRELVLPMVAEHAEAGCAAGGKRYLSGYVDFPDERAWARHYGEAWPWFREAKRRWDPDGLLAPGLVRWS